MHGVGFRMGRDVGLRIARVGFFHRTRERAQSTSPDQTQTQTPDPMPDAGRRTPFALQL
jgi:hypothetical protein